MGLPSTWSDHDFAKVRNYFFLIGKGLASNRLSRLRLSHRLDHRITKTHCLAETLFSDSKEKTIQSSKKRKREDIGSS